MEPQSPPFPIPPGWSVLQTPTGQVYYHHAASNTTQWHPPSHSPAGFYPPPVAPPPNAHPSAPPAPDGYPLLSPSAPSGRPPTGYPGSGPKYPGTSGAGSAAGVTASASPGNGIGHAFTYNEAIEYKLKEKAFSFSGDGFSVKNTSTGENTFKVKGQALSIKDSKKLVDSSGNALYTMTESLISLRGRMHITESGTKNPVVTLRKKGFIPHFGQGTVQIWRGSKDDGEPWIQCKGDFFRKSFDFKEKATGRVLASVRRKSFNLSNLVLEKDSYVIRIEPGVDNALFVFLVVALDELYRDDGNRTGFESRLGGFF